MENKLIKAKAVTNTWELDWAYFDPNVKPNGKLSYNILPLPKNEIKIIFADNYYATEVIINQIKETSCKYTGHVINQLTLLSLGSEITLILQNAHYSRRLLLKEEYNNTEDYYCLNKDPHWDLYKD